MGSKLSRRRGSRSSRSDQSNVDNSAQGHVSQDENSLSNDTNSIDDLDSPTSENQEPSICPTDTNSLTSPSNEPSEKAPFNVLFKVLRSFLLFRQYYNGTTLLCMVFTSLLVAWSVGPLLTPSLSRPKPLFGQSKVIAEYPYGDLSKLSVKISENEASIVMYYSHWDLDCLRFRDGFQRVAQEFGRQVFFAAINCWYPQGECAKVLRLKRYPVILAHVRGIGDVEYRGPLVANYLIPFIENLLDPVIPINNPGDLLDMRSKHDGVLVRFFDFRSTNEPKGYEDFLHSSIKSLSSDPWTKVQFGIVTSRRIAQKLRVTRQTSAYLFMWNSTHEINLGEERILTDNAVKLVFETVNNKGSLVTWFNPSGQKSDLLASFSKSGPTFILFTPRNFLLDWTPYYELVRETAMDYFNCDKSSGVRSLTHRNILRRLVLEQKLVELEELCNELSHPASIVSPENKDSCCSSRSVDWTPSSRTVSKKCMCTVCVQVDISKYPSGGQAFDCQSTLNRYLLPFDPNHHDNDSFQFCNEIRNSFRPPYTPYYRVEFSCSGVTTKSPDMTPTSSRFWTSTSDSADDKIKAMVKSSERDICSKWFLALNYTDLIFPESSEMANLYQERKDSISGLACSANSTLKFVAIDSVLYSWLPRSIGIDIERETHKTAAVILDEKTESVYLLKRTRDTQILSKKLFYEFVQNFTNGSLTRFFRTEKGKISFNEQCLTGKDGFTTVCVPDVTTDSFSSSVLNPDFDVVLFYYTPWCGFCSSVAYVFLTVARFFMHIQGVRFVRINADRNDLPSMYSVDRFPTIILYPAKKKSDSIAYSSNMPITTTGLVQFVLANSQPKVRWQTTFELCSGICLLRNLNFYSNQSRLLHRKVKTTRNELNLLNHVLFWPNQFRYSKHETEQKAFRRHLRIKYYQLVHRTRSMEVLNHLLRMRIARIVSGVQVELTENFMRDMFMLSQERKAPIKSLRKRKKAKKQTNKKRTEPSDEL